MSKTSLIFVSPLFLLDFGCDAFLRPDINLFAFSDPGRLRGCLQQRRLEQAAGEDRSLFVKRNKVSFNKEIRIIHESSRRSDAGQVAHMIKYLVEFKSL